MRRALAALTLLTLALPAPAAAATKEVAISENGSTFDPDRVRTTTGVAVHWSKGAGALMHNVREDGGLFRSGDPTTGQIDYTVGFSAGTFHYYCEVHGSETGGMDGVVKVSPKTSGAPAGPAFTVTWATDASETGSRFDVQYRVGSGSWKSWHRGTTAGSDTFGTDGDPETVRNGTTYAFRARSGDGSAKSRWSPKVSFTA